MSGSVDTLASRSVVSSKMRKSLGLLLSNTEQRLKGVAGVATGLRCVPVTGKLFGESVKFNFVEMDGLPVDLVIGLPELQQTKRFSIARNVLSADAENVLSMVELDVEKLAQANIQADFDENFSKIDIQHLSEADKNEAKAMFYKYTNEGKSSCSPTANLFAANSAPIARL